MPLSYAELAIQKRRVLMKSSLMLFFSILLASLSYKLIYTDKEDELKKLQGQKLFTATNLFSQELGGLSDLLTILANGQALSPKQAEKNEKSNTQYLSLKTQKRVEEYFIQYGKASSRIAQIRWLNNNEIGRAHV